MEDLSVLLAKGVDWTQNVGSIDTRLVEMWQQYRGELAVIKLFVSCMYLEVVRFRCELLLLFNITLETHLGKTKTYKRDA